EEVEGEARTPLETAGLDSPLVRIRVLGREGLALERAVAAARTVDPSAREAAGVREVRHRPVEETRRLEPRGRRLERDGRHRGPGAERGGVREVGEHRIRRGEAERDRD